MIRPFLFFMLSMMMAATSLAEGYPPCTIEADTLPIQIVHAFKPGDVTTLTKADLFDALPGFSAFVKNVTEHIAAKLAQEKLCLDNTVRSERSLLQFVILPVNTSPRTSIPPLETRPYRICRITSPWVDIEIEKKPIPLIRGIFRYSERQLLADQSMLAGAQNVQPGVAMPLSYDEFNRYADLEYASSEIRQQPSKKPIEERVPPDLLWLFRGTGHDSNYPFSDLAGGSMRKAMEVGAEGYTKIVIRLIDQCLESNDGLEIKYNSILEIDEPTLIEQYKIISSIVQMPIP